jgi:low temperature requirement protein LtrA
MTRSKFVNLASIVVLSSSLLGICFDRKSLLFLLIFLCTFFLRAVCFVIKDNKDRNRKIECEKL